MPKIASKLFCLMPIVHQLIQSSYIMYKILRAYLCPFSLYKTYIRYSMPLSCFKDFNQGRKKFDGCNMDQINMFLIGTIVIFTLVIICLWFYTIWEPCIDRGIDSCIVLPDDISGHQSDLLASPGMLKTFS